MGIGHNGEVHTYATRADTYANVERGKNNDRRYERADSRAAQ